MNSIPYTIVPSLSLISISLTSNELSIGSSYRFCTTNEDKCLAGSGFT